MFYLQLFIFLLTLFPFFTPIHFWIHSFPHLLPFSLFFLPSQYLHSPCRCLTLSHPLLHIFIFISIFFFIIFLPIFLIIILLLIPTLIIVSLLVSQILSLNHDHLRQSPRRHRQTHPHILFSYFLILIFVLILIFILMLILILILILTLILILSCSHCHSLHFPFVSQAIKVLGGYTADQLYEMKVAGDDQQYEQICSDALFKTHLFRVSVYWFIILIHFII